MLDLKMAAFADEASRDLMKQIEAMRRNQISMLEIRFVGSKNISEIGLSEAKEIRNILDRNGIRVWSIGSPTGKISLKEEFAPHYEAFRRQLELALILGAKHYRFFSFYDTDNSVACFDLICERMSRFLEAAKESGITLCHENEKGIYGDTALKCARIHCTLPEIKAVFDPANYLQCGEEIMPAWELMAPYIEYLHIKDCNAAGQVVPPGSGKAKLPVLLKKYAGLGKEVVTLEPHLTQFVGLDMLEKGKKTEQIYSFKDGDEAFDTAASSLRKIIEGESLE